MVWTVVLEKEEADTKKIVSVIFEGEHDPTLAYRSFLERSEEFRSNARVIVMVPGRPNYVYFPKENESKVEERKGNQWAI